MPLQSCKWPLLFAFRSRLARRRKTVKLCRALSDLVVYTNSVAAQDIVDDGRGWHRAGMSLVTCERMDLSAAVSVAQGWHVPCH